MAGGLRDQPMYLMRRIRKALNAYRAIMRWKNKPSQFASQKVELKWWAENQDVIDFIHSLELQDS